MTLAFPTRRLAAAAACLAALAQASAWANWASWRGPSGQGYSDDTKVPLTWGEDKNLLWKAPLPGVGRSTPVIWGDRIFLTASSEDGRDRSVLCVRKTDGKLLWQQIASRGVPPGPTHPWNGYASSSCATDGRRVYAFFGTPGLYCYDVQGKRLWKRTFGTFTSVWGTAASPFLYKGLVIVNCDNDHPAALPNIPRPKDPAPQTLVALDKKTGKVRWQTPRNQGRGFSTPRLITTPGGRTDLVLNGPHGVWAYDPDSGREIWHCGRRGREARFGEPVPVSDGATLFAPSGRPGPFQAIRLGGTGDVTRTHVRWQVSRRPHRDVSSQLLWDGLIYAADRSGFLTCYDAKSGAVVYNERLAPDSKSLASPVAVRGKLLFVLDTGETVVLQPGRKFKVVGRNKLGDGSELDFGASPAVNGGRLFLRSQSYLYCIGEKK
jgi:outer membrane protein assembly factor BamB